MQYSWREDRRILRGCQVAALLRWIPSPRCRQGGAPAFGHHVEHQMEYASRGKRMSNRADLDGEKREIRHITSWLMVGNGHAATGTDTFSFDTQLCYSSKADDICARLHRHIETRHMHADLLWDLFIDKYDANIYRHGPRLLSRYVQELQVRKVQSYGRAQ
jgi:hypothetical protein